VAISCATACSASAPSHAHDAAPESDSHGRESDARSKDGGDAAGACVYGGKTYASGASWIGMCDTVNCFCQDGMVSCNYSCTGSTQFPCGGGSGEVSCDATSQFCLLGSAGPSGGSCQPIPSACAGGGTTCSCIVEFSGGGSCSTSEGGVGITVVAGQ
jgi:hypothetical protein